jgi:hypothetical protein
MPKGKVKVEVTNTYYFTPEQWSTHDQQRMQLGTSINEYLESVCLPQESNTLVDLTQLVDSEREKGDKKDVLLG